ncbi:MAG: GDP-mannose 4,6-dehydratase [Candidatus Bathyarchaeota archaeon]
MLHLVLFMECPEYLPIGEGHSLRPLSPYGESKVEAEKLCMDFYEKHGLETVVLRLFNVYGLRMRKDRYGGVVARFVERLKAGKPPVIYGDGEQTRDFIHVDDVVVAMLLALECGSAVGGVFNIATGVPTSINRLAYLVAKILGRVGVKPQHRKERVGDIKHSYADIQKAKTCLGFTPRIALEEGLSTLCVLNEKKNTKS